MANLFEVYSNEDDKYGGSSVENFERQFMLFSKRCDQADILEKDRDEAFSVMLQEECTAMLLSLLESKKGLSF